MSSYPFGSPTDPKYDANGRIIDEESGGGRSSGGSGGGPHQPPAFHIHPYHPHGHGLGHPTTCPGNCAKANKDGLLPLDTPGGGHQQLESGGGGMFSPAPKQSATGGGGGREVGPTGSESSMCSSIPSVTLEDYSGGGGGSGSNEQTLLVDKVMFGGGGGSGGEESNKGVHGKRAVVKIRGGYKRYSRKGPKVLSGYGMTVEEGTIYSLLGSSGCGKTTVLTCILGMRNLDKGGIWVFGKKPGSKGSEVPGRRVGYMPQDIALYGLFSIGETLFYYGRLYGMTSEEIKSRLDFLISFLGLPETSRRVHHLSAGQQRRVSFAVALIHSPPLLILDEPTVGVDALLRERIWEYLNHLVTEQGTTVIITTHYIEEARSSNTIGLMRGGRLLEENDPATLLKLHHALFLEDIVLALCRSDQEQGNKEDAFEGISSSTSIVTPSPSGTHPHPTGAPTHFGDKEECWSIRERRDSITSWVSNLSTDPSSSGVDRKSRSTGFQRLSARVRALILKKMYIMWRNILLVLFMVLTPSLMVLLICNGIGNDPKPIKLGIVNHEASASTCDDLSKWQGADGSGPLKIGCDIQFLSCKYLDQIPKDSITLREYETEFEAHEAVSVGEVVGYLSFPSEYSDNLVRRTFGGGGAVSTDILTNSFITYQLDMSSKLIGGFVKQTLFDTYQDFLHTLLTNCGLNTLLGERPVKALPPIYGTDDSDLRSYIAPSCLLGFIFFFPMCCTSVLYIMDKKQGTLERARVAGVHTSEIMVSYFVVEGLVLILKLALSLTIICVAFGFEVKGSLPLLICIYMLMGIGGVSAGFLLASFCTEEVQAILLAMAAFFPNFLLSGLLWPIESMPYAMQYLTYVLPCTFPAEAVRSIMSRGWGIGHSHVWPGLVTVIAWPWIYWAFTIILHRIAFRRR